MIKIDKYEKTDWYINAIKEIITDGRDTRDLDIKYNEKKFDYDNIFFSIDKSLSFEKIILATYAEIKEIIHNYHSKLKNNSIFKDYFVDKYYDKFSKNNLNNLIISKLDLKTCPYCNIGFVYNRTKDRAQAQLDHFYNKNKYPYLAISLYNLIPSCPSCNHIKGEKPLNISPFDENYDFQKNIKISYIPQSCEFLSTNNKKSIKINIKTNENDNITEDIDTLKLEDLYQPMSDYALEIIKKAQLYPQSKIHELREEFSHLFSSEEELKQVIFGNYLKEKDFKKRPLSKLTHDILEELDIY